MRASALAAAAWCAPAAAPVVPAAASLFRIPLRVRRGIVVTFDDGPHAEGTPAVLAALAEARARATFFLVGEQVDRLPALAAEIAAAGHELGIHGYRHTLLLRRTPWRLADDLDRAAEAIAAAAGREPRVYRPPYGVFSLAALQLVRRRGWSPLLWSRWGRDWEARATADSIAARACRSLGAGDVVLLHDADHYSSFGSWRKTAAALPRILDAALATGEELVSASDDT